MVSSEVIMKKLLLLIITFSMIVSLFACNESEKKDDGGKNEVINVTAWATHLTDKQIANVKPKNISMNTVYDLYMMRGETEGCQLIIYSDKDIKKGVMESELDKYADKNLTSEIFVMNKTHTIKGKKWTDSAIPYYGTKIAFDSRLVTPFIVEFTTTKDTPAGDYAYSYEFKNAANNEVLASFTVNVHVWDIVLPEDKTFATSAGINGVQIARFDRGPEMYKKYYDMLLEHNVCGHVLPYDILSEEAEAYMSDPRVTSFVIGIWDAKLWDDEKLLQYYNRVKENPVWFEKAIVYVIDGPTTEEALANYREYCDRFAKL